MARRERRAYSLVCEERATKPAGLGAAARLGRGGGRASAALPLLDDGTASRASRCLASARPALAPKCNLYSLPGPNVIGGNPTRPKMSWKWRSGFSASIIGSTCTCAIQQQRCAKALSKCSKAESRSPRLKQTHELKNGETCLCLASRSSSSWY